MDLTRVLWSGAGAAASGAGDPLANAGAPYVFEP